MKPAGGIRNAGDARAYQALAAEFFPEVTAANFRIGASTLLDDLVAEI